MYQPVLKNSFPNNSFTAIKNLIIPKNVDMPKTKGIREELLNYHITLANVSVLLCGHYIW